MDPDTQHCNINLSLHAGPGETKAAIERAEGRTAATEAGHVRVHRGHRQALGAAPAQTEALQTGTRALQFTCND